MIENIYEFVVGYTNLWITQRTGWMSPYTPEKTPFHFAGWQTAYTEAVITRARAW